MGNGSVIYPGDVQMMSAGTGILHSEMNPHANKAVHLLQIWIMPDRKGVKPRYQQVHFTDDDKRGVTDHAKLIHKRSLKIDLSGIIPYIFVRGIYDNQGDICGYSCSLCTRAKH